LAKAASEAFEDESAGLFDALCGFVVERAARQSELGPLQAEFGSMPSVIPRRWRLSPSSCADRSTACGP
jgi:hypothetical protein